MGYVGTSPNIGREYQCTLAYTPGINPRVSVVTMERCLLCVLTLSHDCRELAVRRLLIQRRPANSLSVFVPAGHLIVHEKPKESGSSVLYLVFSKATNIISLAQEVHRFLETKYGLNKGKL